MNHEQRHAKGRTTNSGKSLTDQSQADDTNINVILKKYGVTGVAYGKPGEPEYLDHSKLPNDLRDAIHLARQLTDLKQRLPEALRERPIEELNSLTLDQLNTILAPPKEKPSEQTSTEGNKSGT